MYFLIFLFNTPAPSDLYTLSLHDALPISSGIGPFTGQYVHFKNYAPEKIAYALNRYEFEALRHWGIVEARLARSKYRSEEHTSELQSLRHLVCRLLLEKKKKKQ